MEDAAPLDRVEIAKDTLLLPNDRSVHLAAALAEYHSLRKTPALIPARKRVDWRPW